MANEYGGGIFVSCVGEEKPLLGLAATGSALVYLLLKLANLPTDDELESYDTLAALLGRCPEADFTNYARQTTTTPLTVRVNKDVTPGRLDIVQPSLSYTAAGGATNNDIGKVVVAYRPAVGSTDSAIRPVAHYRCVLTTDGTTRRIDPNSAGSISLDARRVVA